MAPRMELLESLSGSDYAAMQDAPAPAAGQFPAIQAAVAVFLPRFPTADLTQYRIDVYREGELLHVIFLDKERPPGMRGSGGRPGCPGFEVTLESADLSLVEAHFIK